MHADVFQTMNAGYAQLMYEQWLRDPMAVDEEWRAAFSNGWRGVEPDERAGGPADARTSGRAELSAVSRQPSATRRPAVRRPRRPSAAARCA